VLLQFIKILKKYFCYKNLEESIKILKISFLSKILYGSRSEEKCMDQLDPLYELKNLKVPLDHFFFT